MERGWRGFGGRNRREIDRRYIVAKIPNTDISKRTYSITGKVSFLDYKDVPRGSDTKTGYEIGWGGGARRIMAMANLPKCGVTFAKNRHDFAK